ncbi:hypothetical protein PTSG_11646 [Salpingoeca rosetta]|uniref:PH domain-containing protein n=1 Tax=Salpingoeca rosetta (strain ATCC 50818 / BSB-021) TaxID=946362 RepID=F2TXK6_SALR5|nr:uncharacterized protein PTSG_11646 [Salpingoeca rosetta]EGD76115.1 hypothetical protein PTSG_11646 [Salpingoeca rosetta]|eukprot:XP_004998290.1 hypothetical protein PTSG_11646 [Salpingoeca rosetta]
MAFLFTNKQARSSENTTTAMSTVGGAAGTCGRQLLEGVLAQDVVRVDSLLGRATKTDVNTKDNEGTSCLHHAALLGNSALVDLLLSAGAAVNAQDAKEMTPLHLAAWGGHTAVLSQLLNAGASASSQSANGDTPLHLACQQGSTEAVKQLVDFGANLTAGNDANVTPLMVACERGRAPIVEQFLQLQKTFGHSVVHVQLWKERTSVFEPSSDSHPPQPRDVAFIMRAVERDHAHIIHLLADYGIDLCFPPKNPPIVRAALLRKPWALHALLQHDGLRTLDLSKDERAQVTALTGELEDTRAPVPVLLKLCAILQSKSDLHTSVEDAAGVKQQQQQQQQQQHMKGYMVVPCVEVVFSSDDEDEEEEGDEDREEEDAQVHSDGGAEDTGGNHDDRDGKLGDAASDEGLTPAQGESAPAPTAMEPDATTTPTATTTATSEVRMRKKGRKAPRAADNRQSFLAPSSTHHDDAGVRVRQRSSSIGSARVSAHVRASHIFPPSQAQRASRMCDVLTLDLPAPPPPASSSSSSSSAPRASHSHTAAPAALDIPPPPSKPSPQTPISSTDARKPSASLFAITPSVTEGMQANPHHRHRHLPGRVGAAIGGSVLPDSIIEGSLYKRPRGRTNRIAIAGRLRHRWFVLTEAALSYYEYDGKKAGKLKGYIPLYSILGAQASPADEREFMVLHDTAILRCISACKEERESWMTNINRTCLRVQQESKQQVW